MSFVICLSVFVKPELSELHGAAELIIITMGFHCNAGCLSGRIKDEDLAPSGNRRRGP